VGNYNITGSQIAGDHSVQIGELHIEELHLHLACDPKGRRKDMEKESYNDKCHRLMAEAGTKMSNARGDTLDVLLQQVAKLKALLTLLAGCTEWDAFQGAWADAVWGLSDFVERIEELSQKACEAEFGYIAKIKELTARLQKLEAPPTAGKQNEEAPKD